MHARAAVAVLLAMGIAGASAHDNMSQELNGWLKGLKNKSGEGCCDTADGYPAEAQWDRTTNKYRVFIEGEWYEVPDHAIIEKPNRIGYAMVWWYPSSNTVGKRTPNIRCFIPGAGG